jgi:putative transposase
VTFTVVGWVDVFTRKETINAFRYCIENKGLKIYGYVIMSNHIHAIIQATEDMSTLSDLIRDYKKHTSKEIIKWMNESNKESRKEWMQMVLNIMLSLTATIQSIKFGFRITDQRK